MSYTPILPSEIVSGQPVKSSIVQRLDANDQSVPSPMVFLTGALNTWTAPESKWYRITITAAGAPTGASIGGGGATGIKRIYVTKGTLWTATFNTGSQAWTDFTDGVTLLRARSGTDSTVGGTETVGCDLTIPSGNSSSIYGNRNPAFGAGSLGPALIIIEG